MRRAVHFGAGNIGRGFIGQLLYQAGYDVVFVDVNREVVDELNRRQAYDVQLATAEAPLLPVERVRALDARDVNTVAEVIAGADLVTTAVGVHILPHLAETIAHGISRRLATTDRPLNVIACENKIGSSTFLREQVWRYLGEAEQIEAAERIGFPDAAVDRIVPVQQHEDKLRVTVEPFFEWVVEQPSIKGELPDIAGVTYVEQIRPYVERKLYTVNTGHAMLAYLGHLRGYATIDQAMEDTVVRQAAKGVLRETGQLLSAKHGFDPATHAHYTEKILERFANPLLDDKVTRVGRDPISKLAPDNRLVAPAMECVERGIVPEYLGMAIAAALLFDCAEDTASVRLQSEIRELGLRDVLHSYTQIPPGHVLEGIVLRHVKELQKTAQSTDGKAGV